MTERAIDVRGLHKSYGDLEAVKGIDVHVDVGEVFALLGPNGAGKTTTVEILEGYRERTAGEVSVLGFDPASGSRALKERVGIVLQSTGIDPFLTVAETISLYSGYYPHPRPVDEVIDVVGLDEKRDSRVVKLSGGQQRRLDVAIALAGDPELLFLDEPTTGFDPTARRGAWEVVKNLASLGKTVLLTTHYMDEAQYLADRVAVIAAGQIVAEGPPSTLAGRDVGRTHIRFRPDPGAELPPVAGGDASRRTDGWVEFESMEPTRALHELTSWAVDRGVELDGLEVRRPSLEDVYLELTGDQHPEAQPEPVASGRGRRRGR
ncbi:MAG TPA: ABC transporter ATP-binding protein [Actinomycetota bacterium]|jgi:ABC-2 type transport system ATP-binding protein